jgi:phosphatidylinositol-3-phosphatase
MLLRPAKGRVVRIRETRGWAMLASSAGRSLALTSLALTGLAAASVTARPAHAAMTASTVTVASPGPQTSKAGRRVTLRIHATDTDSRNLSFHAIGLPGGLSISLTTGVISGTPSDPGSSLVTVAAIDDRGATGGVSFRWTVSPARPGCPADQLLGNPGFETGRIAPWQGSQGVVANVSDNVPAHSGSWLAWLGGYTTPHTDTIEQTVTIPASCNSATLVFWLQIASNVPRSEAVDTFRAQVVSPGGSVLATLATYTDQATSRDYQQHAFDLSRFTGQEITVRFTGREASTGGYVTSFYTDDCTLNVS